MARFQDIPDASDIATPATHPNHAVVGWIWRGHDGHDYFCDSYDPHFGFWMTRVDAPAQHRADTGGAWRRNVSERAINRAFGRARRGKVLFLDIDGVLKVEDEFRRSIRIEHLPRIRTARLQEVLNLTGAQIVVSSTHRESDQTLTKLQRLGLWPFHPDWRTPFPTGEQRVGSILVANSRGREIADWLARHPEVTRYAIVDDEALFLPEQMPNFARTTFAEGLTREVALKLVGILGEVAR